MANHKSAEKRIRQTKKRTARNRMRLSRIHTYVRKVDEAVSTGNKDEAMLAFKAVVPELHRGVSRGVLHKKTAARKISRLNLRVKALS